MNMWQRFTDYRIRLAKDTAASRDKQVQALAKAMAQNEAFYQEEKKRLLHEVARLEDMIQGLSTEIDRLYSERHLVMKEHLSG